MSAAKSAGGGVDTIGYDVATALWQGKRPYQEDTLLADFHGGMDRGFAVLADGMGGHAAGDLASRLVVIDAVSHLKFLMHDGKALEKNLQSELTSAIQTANDVLKDRASEDRRLQGMGATFLATVMFEDRLYWASVGDSPLYLWREGKLRQLNEDHSMAPVIDQMAKSGELTEEEAANHPDRNALTSVLMGRSVKSMDVPDTAMVLDPGDYLIQASDGLQYLDDEKIAEVLGGMAEGASSRDIADALMRALHDLDDPAQDNTAILVLQLTEGMGGKGGGMPANEATAASNGERAVSSKSGATAAVAAGGAETARAAAGPVPDPIETSDADPAPPEKRRSILVPAALLGGAALAVGLIFGLPSSQDDTDLTAVQPQAEAEDVVIEQPEPEGQGTDVAADPDPVPETPEDSDVSPDAPEANETAAPDADEGDNSPAVDPENPEARLTEADGDPVDAPSETDPDTEDTAAETGTPEDTDTPQPTEGELAPDADGVEISPAEAGALETVTPEEPAADDTVPDPTRSGDVPAPSDPDTETPDRATGADAQGSATPADDMPDVSTDEETAAPAELTEEDAPDNLTPDATQLPSPAIGDALLGTGATSGLAIGAAPITEDTTPEAMAEPIETPGGSDGEAGTTPQPAPVPVPAPASTPAPQPAPAPAAPSIESPEGAEEAASPTTSLPGVGTLREGLSAPTPTPTPVPLPQTQPEAGPLQPQIIPRAPVLADPAITEIDEDDRATQTAPRQPSVIGTPVPQGGTDDGATVTPMLPPFTGSIQRICQAQQCFAIIRRPDGTVTVLQRRR